jgi:hypothetical protein
MALSISVQTQFGFPATYWRIGDYYETFESFGKATMQGFLNADNSDSTPLAIYVLEIRGEEYTPEMDRAAIYAIAKLRPEFEGAEDI